MIFFLFLCLFLYFNLDFDERESGGLCVGGWMSAKRELSCVYVFEMCVKWLFDDACEFVFWSCFSS